MWITDDKQLMIKNYLKNESSTKISIINDEIVAQTGYYKDVDEIIEKAHELNMLSKSLRDYYSVEAFKQVILDNNLKEEDKKFGVVYWVDTD